MADLERPSVTEKPKKRKILGSQRDLQKMQRLSNHSTGVDCGCTRYKCFESVNEAERANLISVFNDYATKNEQDAYLSCLMRTSTVKRRRPRQVGGEENVKPKNMSVSYYVCVKRGPTHEALTICVKAFCYIYGITKNRVETIRNALFKTG